MQEIGSGNQRAHRLIDKLTQWTRKPNLEYNLSAILDSYATQIHEDPEIPHSALAATTNFAEAGLFLQSSATVYAKRLDLLYKHFISYNLQLLDLLRPGLENASSEEQQNVAEPQPATPSDSCKKPDAKKKVKAAAKENQESAVTSVDGSKKIVKTENDTAIGEKKDEESARDTVQFRIQSILNRVVANPKLQDLDLGTLSEACTGAEDESHPLHPIFVMNGDELNIAKDMFTVNDVELTGLCWRMLYQLEKKLNSVNAGAVHGTDDSVTASTNPCSTCANNESSGKTAESSEVSASEKISEVSANANGELNKTSDGSADKSIAPLSSENTTNQSVTVENNETSDVSADKSIPPLSSENTTTQSVNVENNAEVNRTNELSENVQSVGKELRVCIEPLSKAVLNKYLKTSESPEQLAEKEIEVYVQDIKINLFRFPEKMLTRKKLFTLPSNCLLALQEKSRRNIKQPQETTKRKLHAETEDECVPVKMLKSYELAAFEEFSYEFNVRAGLLPPRPEESIRKSVDARSDRSFPCPITPDSGRFSLSCGFDSEWENPDTDAEQTTSQYHIADDNENEDVHETRAADVAVDEDSGMDSTSLHDAGYESDRAIEGLKELFPNITKNPQMLSLAKEIINTTKPPESENYLEWKRFIDNKTAGEKEFDIHEFGSNILHTFPSNSTENVIAFERIVEGRTAEDVTRYFVSTLQLANFENIEIIDQYPGQIRPDSIKLKFITDTRHHETLRLTPGPSEADFMSRLECRQSGSMLQSTPHGHKFRRSANSPTFSLSGHS